MRWLTAMFLATGCFGSLVMMMLDRGGIVERGEQDGVVSVHHLLPSAIDDEWWWRKEARRRRGLGGEEEVEPSMVCELHGSLKKLSTEAARLELSTMT
jgi:hypothetical protein